LNFCQYFEVIFPNFEVMFLNFEVMLVNLEFWSKFWGYVPQFWGYVSKLGILVKTLRLCSSILRLSSRLLRLLYKVVSINNSWKFTTVPHKCPSAHPAMSSSLWNDYFSPTNIQKSKQQRKCVKINFLLFISHFILLVCHNFVKDPFLKINHDNLNWIQLLVLLCNTSCAILFYDFIALNLSFFSTLFSSQLISALSDLFYFWDDRSN